MKLRFFMVILCLVLLLSVPINASEIDQIVLLLWHGLILEDLAHLDLHGAWGLMNVRAGGGHAPSGTYLSLGAGARAVGMEQAGNFSESKDSHKLYEMHTNLESAPIVNLGIAQIIAAQKVNYTVTPGALGTALGDSGNPPVVLGNSNTEKSISWGSTVAMDHNGRVWQGNIGDEFLVKDPLYPYGLKTDYDLLKAAIHTTKEKLVVVDMGDLYRYQTYEVNLLPEQRDRLRTRMILEASNFLANLYENKLENTVLMVVGSYPHSGGIEQGHWLTPVIFLGLGEGLLTSGTTRWPGVITNMDLAPTLLDLLGIGHEYPFVGRSIQVQPNKEPLNHLFTLRNKIFAVAGHRNLVLKIVIIAQILLYSCVLALLIMQSAPTTRLILILRGSLLVFLFLPLVLLLFSNPWRAGVALIFFAFFALKLRTAPLWKVGIIALLTVFVIGIDQFMNNRLIRFSILGYDPIGGARFYGLGNEFMGIFIGAVVMGWAILCHFFKLQRGLRDIIGLILFTFSLALIGAPSLGTNVGGAIAGVFAFGSVWLAFRVPRIRWQHGVYLLLVMALVLILLMTIDHQNPGSEQSHIGQTVHLFNKQGFLALQLIISRKLAMNFKLMRHSMWSKALLIAMGVMGASFIWPSKFISWLRKNYPLLAKGIGGVVVGSIAALVFNDSGVVAAATCLYFASSTLLLLALELKHDLHTPQSNIQDNSHSHQTGEHGAPASRNEGEGQTSDGHDP